jgi:hypothetical protein
MSDFCAATHPPGPPQLRGNSNIFQSPSSPWAPQRTSARPVKDIVSFYGPVLWRMTLQKGSLASVNRQMALGMNHSLTTHSPSVCVFWRILAYSGESDEKGMIGVRRGGIRTVSRKPVSHTQPAEIGRLGSYPCYRMAPFSKILMHAAIQRKQFDATKDRHCRKGEHREEFP